MKTSWSRSILQLVAWHSFLVSVFIVAPLCLCLGSLDLVDWVMAKLATVVCLHFGLIALEFSLSATLTPRRLTGFLFLGVPVLYVVVLVDLHAMHYSDWLVRAFVLLFHSAFTNVRILRSAVDSSSFPFDRNRPNVGTNSSQSPPTRMRW